MIKLETIRVLWRQPDLMSLWGIPYAMRPGQSPRQLWESRKMPDTAAQAAGYYGRTISDPGPREGWIWLGQPGWWGRYDKATQDAITAFLEPLRAAGVVPTGPAEWSDVTVELHAQKPAPDWQTCECASCFKRRDLSMLARELMRDGDDE
jgi:hypothetical protein